MARAIGTFVLIVIAGIVGIYLGSIILDPIFLGLLFAIAMAGAAITYYQSAADARELEKEMKARQKAQEEAEKAGTGKTP